MQAYHQLYWIVLLNTTRRQICDSRKKTYRLALFFRFSKRDRYKNKLQYDNWSSKLSYYPIIHNINFNFWVVWWDKGNWNIIHQFAAMPQATYYVQGNREFRQGLNTNVTIVDVSDLFQILILPKRDPIVQIQVSNLFNWLRSTYVRTYLCMQVVEMYNRYVVFPCAYSTR